MHQEQDSSYFQTQTIHSWHLPNPLDTSAFSRFTKNAPLLSRLRAIPRSVASLLIGAGLSCAALIPVCMHLSTSSQHDWGAHLSSTIPLPLPHITLRPEAATNTTTWQLVRITQGQTLSGVFQDHNLPMRTVDQIVSYPPTHTALTHLHVGSQLFLDIPNPGYLRAIRFDISPESRVELTLDGNTVKQRFIPREQLVRDIVHSAKITHSLWQSAEKSQLSPREVSTLTDDIFKYDIDFDRDLHPGDRFNVIVQEKWQEGERLPTSIIRAATFTIGNKQYTAFRFEYNHKVGYYDASGRPLKKSFIRMPIPFARLTSRFGMRYHPILGKMRMHNGVDYAAPQGTPIMAAGDARVVFIGQKTGYGNVIILDHGHGYSTLYGHMSRFAHVHLDQVISQGTVIGYVGMTGLATAPHLHYEFRVNGVHRDPLTVTMPPPEPLRGPALLAFQAAIAPMQQELKQRDILNLAANAPGKPGLLSRN